MPFFDNGVDQVAATPHRLWLDPYSLQAHQSGIAAPIVAGISVVEVGTENVDPGQRRSGRARPCRPHHGFLRPAVDDENLHVVRARRERPFRDHAGHHPLVVLQVGLCRRDDNTIHRDRHADTFLDPVWEGSPDKQRQGVALEIDSEKWGRVVETNGDVGPDRHLKCRKLEADEGRVRPKSVHACLKVQQLLLEADIPIIQGRAVLLQPHPRGAALNECFVRSVRLGHVQE